MHFQVDKKKQILCLLMPYQIPTFKYLCTQEQIIYLSPNNHSLFYSNFFAWETQYVTIQVVYFFAGYVVLSKKMQMGNDSKCHKIRISNVSFWSKHFKFGQNTIMSERHTAELPLATDFSK